MDLSDEPSDETSVSEEADQSPVSTELPTDLTFDSALTTTHSYLGNLETLRGRTLLDDGIYRNLPILFENSVILFPEQTLPMLKYGTRFTKMFWSCIGKDRTFGVVCWGQKRKTALGTTAEIYEYSNSYGFRIKARGRQRFRIIRARKVNDQIFADVKILPEIVLGPPFFDERLASLDRKRTIPKNEEEAQELESKVTRYESIITPWPSWVYRQYDSRRLAMNIHKNLQFVESRGSKIPEDPVELSFWLAQNLFINDKSKITLLQYDCAIQRLQFEAKILSMLGDKCFKCSTCRRVIGKHSDLIPMNREGLQAAYCNLAGAIHETVTLSKATGIILSREPASTVCSWFPGYAWRIGHCANCIVHIGWLFEAVNEYLKPRTFWGLRRKNLILTQQCESPQDDETEDSPNSPFFTYYDGATDYLFHNESDGEDETEGGSVNFHLDLN